MRGTRRLMAGEPAFGEANQPEAGKSDQAIGGERYVHSLPPLDVLRAVSSSTELGTLRFSKGGVEPLGMNGDP